MEISYTFPADFRHEQLRGVEAKGGRAVLRSTQGKIDENGEWDSGVRKLGIVFEDTIINGRPLSISVENYPELLALANAQIVSEVAVSDTHSVKRTTDYMNIKTGVPIQFGKILKGTHDVPATVKCAQQAEADGWARSNVFGIVNHPEHGYIAVTSIELMALGLPEIEGWDFLAAA